MSEAKHTPGPWELIRHGDFLDIIQLGRDGYGTICRIEDADCDPPNLRKLAESNARLMAAAPELLEALNAYRLHHQLLLQVMDDTDCPCLICQMAAGAIAKAKGE